MVGASVAMYARCADRHNSLTTTVLKNKVQKCGNCSFQTISKLHFLKHFCEITKKGFQCQECYQVLSRRACLRTHMQVRHLSPDQQKWFTCERCEFRSLRKYVLTQHTLRKHLSKEEKANKSYKCDQCDYQNLMKLGMKRHMMRMHSNSKNWRCNECEFETTAKTYLDSHIRRRHMHVEKIQCDICKTLVNKLDVRKHITQVHRNKKQRLIKCNLCEEAFETVESLDHHRLNDHQSGKIVWNQCPHCEYKTLYKKSLRGHLFRKHEEGSGGFQCDFCKYKAFYKTALKEHIYYKHTKGENISWFKCEDCDYKAKRKSALNIHIMRCKYKATAPL